MITVLYKGHGKPVLLGEELDINVQLYLRRFEKEEVEYLPEQEWQLPEV